ncbi:HlyD family secretion protein [Rhodopirellula sp. MGV]|uniref:HlyD family secretion protein n=1 Tax=Rhodopirellula sp. MGV TaxID=2023130 RepID=UPI000B961B32|nr:HlyD family efflux transporter periplasmic adaptor subunit [Rhodopirellula sp. MGV]OYP32268.1 hypothetical protein CGZ80_19555 [Rhodopirellula sp. MGV]PNY35949.1 hypothetical protein C2E31_15925 [Rhodopirellula baltica]
MSVLNPKHVEQTAGDQRTEASISVTDPVTETVAEHVIVDQHRQRSDHAKAAKPSGGFSMLATLVVGLLLVVGGLAIWRPDDAAILLEAALVESGIWGTGSLDDGSSELVADESLAFGSGQADAISSARPLPVEVVLAGSIPPPVLSTGYTGLLVPVKRSLLGFERGGKVTQIGVHEGDFVQRGDLLAVIAQDDLDATQSRIESELAAARAILAELVAGPRVQAIEAASAEVKKAKARVMLAEVEANRQLKLASGSATSRSELDAARFGLDAERSQLASATATLEELTAGTREEQIAAQRARCEVIQASLGEIQSQRNRSRVVAPFDGQVAGRMVDEGEVIAPGAAVLELISHALEAQVALPPSVAAGLQRGDNVILRLGEQLRTGRIDRREPTVRRDTRTRVVFAELGSLKQAIPDRIDAIASGQNIERSGDVGWVAGEVIELIPPRDPTQRLENGVWLPSSALVRGAHGLWTTLVIPAEDLNRKAIRVDVDVSAADGSGVPREVEFDPPPTGMVCERRAVEVLQTDGVYVLVQGMIREGDAVLSRGLHRVTAGTNVEPIFRSRGEGPVADDIAEDSM